MQYEIQSDTQEVEPELAQFIKEQAGMIEMDGHKLRLRQNWGANSDQFSLELITCKDGLTIKKDLLTKAMFEENDNTAVKRFFEELSRM